MKQSILLLLFSQLSTVWTTWGLFIFLTSPSHTNMLINSHSGVLHSVWTHTHSESCWSLKLPHFNDFLHYLILLLPFFLSEHWPTLCCRKWCHSCTVTEQINTIYYSLLYILYILNVFLNLNTDQRSASGSDATAAEQIT